MTDTPMVAAEVTATRIPAAVQFSHPREFAAELRRDRAEVHRGLVRLSCEYRPAEDPPCQELSVIAGYLVDTGSGVWQQIELRHPCGPLWGLGHDSEVQERAERIRSTVEQAIADAGLECRPGRLMTDRR
jgi:hypothetical protein